MRSPPWQPETCAEGGNKVRRLGGGAAAQEPDERHGRSLCLSAKRRGEHGSEARDERAAVH